MTVAFSFFRTGVVIVPVGQDKQEVYRYICEYTVHDYIFKHVQTLGKLLKNMCRKETRVSTHGAGQAL